MSQVQYASRFTLDVSLSCCDFALSPTFLIPLSLPPRFITSMRARGAQARYRLRDQLHSLEQRDHQPAAGRQLGAQIELDDEIGRGGTGVQEEQAAVGGRLDTHFCRNAAGEEQTTRQEAQESKSATARSAFSRIVKSAWACCLRRMPRHRPEKPAPMIRTRGRPVRSGARKRERVGACGSWLLKPASNEVPFYSSPRARTTVGEKWLTE